MILNEGNNVLFTVISLCFIVGLTGCFDGNNTNNGTAILKANESPWSPGFLHMTGSDSSPGDGNNFVSHTFTVQSIGDSDEDESTNALFTKTIKDGFHDYYISEVPVDDKTGTIELIGPYRVTLTTINNRGDVKVATKIIEFNTLVSFISLPNTESGNESDDPCTHTLSSKTYDDVETAIFTLADADGCYSFKLSTLFDNAPTSYSLSDDSTVAFLAIGGTGGDGADYLSCFAGNGGDAGGAMMTTTYGQWDDDYGNSQELYYFLGSKGTSFSHDNDGTTNDDGTAYYASGGFGGASTILSANKSDPNDTLSRVLVAGGGGGGAGCAEGLTVYSIDAIGGDGGVAIPSDTNTFTYIAGDDGKTSSNRSKYTGYGGYNGIGGEGGTYSGDNNDGGDDIGGFGGGRNASNQADAGCTALDGVGFINNSSLTMSTGYGGQIGVTNTSTTISNQPCQGGSGGGGFGGGGGSYTEDLGYDGSAGAGGGGSMSISSYKIDATLDSSDTFKSLRSSATSSHGSMIVILKPSS